MRHVSIPSGLGAGLFLALALSPRAAPAATHTVTDAGDTNAPGQLRTILRDVAGPGDVVLIPAGLTIVLALGPAGDDASLSGDLDVSQDVSIQGAGPGLSVVDGGDLDRVFHIRGGATVALRGLTVRHGRSPAPENGGAIKVDSPSTLILTSVVLTQNHSGRFGGAVAFSGGAGAFSGVTIADNEADDDSGAIDVSGAVLTLVNTTMSGNRAGGGGGAMTVLGTDSDVRLTNVTITGNRADGNGGGINRLSDGLVLLRDTIVAGNTPGGAGVGPDCQGPLVSLGHNLFGVLTADCTVGGVTTGNLTGDAGLGPLALNGGPTPTHALLPGSQALDAGDAACAAADQRGVLRPQGGRCDIGAFERGGAGLGSLDFDGDGTPDVVVASGRGGEPRVRVLSGATGGQILSFLAYAAGMRAGVRVATCDLNGDGVPDVVTAPGQGPVQVRVFDGTTGAPFPGPLGGFLAFPGSARSTGAHVGCLDLDGDGVPDVVVTAPGYPASRVLSFSGIDASPLGEAVALPGFPGEVFVAP